MAKNLLQVSHVDTEPQGFEPSSTAFLGHKKGAE